MTVCVSPALAELQAAVARFVAADVRDTPEAHRLGEQEVLLGIINQLRAVEVHRLEVIDNDETTVVDTGRATRSWLIEEAQVNPGEATKRVRLARALAAHPLVDDAFSAGNISFEHAWAIITAMRPVPVEFHDIVERALVDAAHACPPYDIGEMIEPLLVACGVESSSDEAHVRRLNRRGLTIARTFDGLRAVSGLLTPDVAEAFETALDVIGQRAGDDDDRTHAQRQHDAVGELAHHYLAHAAIPAVRGERPRVVVTIDYDSLVSRLHDRANQLGESWGHLPSGAVVSPSTARRLACDAEIIPAVLNARGDVLDVAIASRSFPTAVRRAAWLEQKGRCAFPGCRRPPVDCHHIVWWTNGGPSTLENAAWLCAFHHWLVHERGWTMRRDPERGFVFTGPAGQVRPRHPEAA
ncbi:MAG TPA: DUF222 domain-containing protein [Mycobacteriales bacterium]|nr:DUF222 domain-containing protein [Mycobacteriales bacterium]